MRRLKTLCAAAVAALATAAALPGAALAGTSSGQGTDSVQWFSDCTPGYFCVFENDNGTGHWFRNLQAPFPDLTQPVAGFVYNDQISSVFNRTDRTWCLYVSTNFGGRALPISPGWGGPLEPKYHFDGVTSSFRLQPAGGC